MGAAFFCACLCRCALVSGETIPFMSACMGFFHSGFSGSLLHKYTCQVMPSSRRVLAVNLMLCLKVTGMKDKSDFPHVCILLLSKPSQHLDEIK